MDADEILKSEIPNEPEKRASQPPTSIPSELEVGVADVRLEEDNKTGEQAGLKSKENEWKTLGTLIIDNQVRSQRDKKLFKYFEMNYCYICP